MAVKNNPVVKIYIYHPKRENRRVGRKFDTVAMKEGSNEYTQGDLDILEKFPEIETMIENEIITVREPEARVRRAKPSDKTTTPGGGEKTPTPGGGGATE